MIPDHFRFAFASCQRWDQGLYTAYEDLASNELDLVVHLGDYIYEYSIGTGDQLRPGDYPGTRSKTPNIAGRVPAPLRALQIRPCPAGGAPDRAMAGHLG